MANEIVVHISRVYLFYVVILRVGTIVLDIQYEY